MSEFEWVDIVVPILTFIVGYMSGKPIAYQCGVCHCGCDEAAEQGIPLLASIDVCAKCVEDIQTLKRERNEGHGRNVHH